MILNKWDLGPQMTSCELGLCLFMSMATVVNVVDGVVSKGHFTMRNGSEEFDGGHEFELRLFGQFGHFLNWGVRSVDGGIGENSCSQEKSIMGRERSEEREKMMTDQFEL